MDWKIISNSEPTACYTGKLWIQPGISGVKSTSAFLKLGATFFPIGTTDTIPFTYKRITYLIDGIDKSSLCKDLTIDDVLTSEVDTCTFTLDDLDGDNKPQVGQEVVIFYKETSTSEPEIRFAGKIVEAPQIKISAGVYSYEIVCTDYTQELQRNLVVESYTSQSAGDIIKDIIENYAEGLGTYYVEDGITVDYISFNYTYPLECIEELAELIGYDWYVDYERNIHFFARTTNEVPYNLTETGDLDNEEYRDLHISVDKSQLKNVQTVRGGYELSDDYTQTWIVQAGQHELPIAYQPYAADSGAIELSIDAGGNITPGIDNIDTTDDYVVNVSEKTLKDQNSNWSGGEVVVLIYKYKKPILARVKDKPSIALMKQYEGGDGIYHGELIVDETIKTKDAARQRAQAAIDMYSNPLVEGSFITTKYGFRSGQLLTVNLSSRDINSTYLIQNVTATHIGSGEFEYEIIFATRLKGLTDFLIELYDNGKKIFERTDELLDILEVFDEDEIVVTDVTPTTELRDITTNQYVWCNDAGTTPDKGEWNLAQWG